MPITPTQPRLITASTLLAYAQYRCRGFIQLATSIAAQAEADPDAAAPMRPVLLIENIAEQVSDLHELAGYARGCQHPELARQIDTLVHQTWEAVIDKAHALRSKRAAPLPEPEVSDSSFGEFEAVSAGVSA